MIILLLIATKNGFFTGFDQQRCAWKYRCRGVVCTTTGKQSGKDVYGEGWSG